MMSVSVNFKEKIAKYRHHCFTDWSTVDILSSEFTRHRKFTKKQG